VVQGGFGYFEADTKLLEPSGHGPAKIVNAPIGNLNLFRLFSDFY
jgi:hypothetical protein